MWPTDLDEEDTCDRSLQNLWQLFTGLLQRLCEAFAQLLGPQVGVLASDKGLQACWLYFCCSGMHSAVECTVIVVSACRLNPPTSSKRTTTCRKRLKQHCWSTMQRVTVGSRFLRYLQGRPPLIMI